MGRVMRCAPFRRRSNTVGRTGADERGVAMVEFAMILPLLIVLFIGVTEFGFAFKTKLLVDNATQVAARTGSALGQNEDADLRILEALEQGFASLPNSGDGQVLQAQVYLVEPGGVQSATWVNTYLYQYDPNPAICNWNPCPTTEAQVPTWKPSLRDTKLDGGLEDIGVTVYYGYSWVIGGAPFLGDVSCTDPTLCWTEKAVMRLEPTE